MFQPLERLQEAIKNRKLLSKKRKQAQKYKEEVTNRLKRLKIGERMESLYENRKGYTRKKRRILLDEIDRNMIESMMQAEGRIPGHKQWSWSPKVVLAGMIKAYWSSRVKVARYISPPPVESWDELR